jgi:microsomal dipeptidase-like Zn-dependent dipeptidase
MSTRLRARALLLGLTLPLLIWIVLGLQLERWINRVDPAPLPPVTPLARRIHDASFVADLHADSLLFGRDLLALGTRGHVDLPRLQLGGVALQVFSLPTVVPFGLNLERNERGRVDLLTLAGAAQLSPTAVLGPMGRALYRADALQAFALASEGELVMIQTRGDLERLGRARLQGSPQIGALLALEGAHALESTPANLERALDAGYRMIGLTHFFDNDYAGSAHGVTQGGLTALGRRTIADMERLGITLDLAHLAPSAIDEALDLSTRPTVSSHGGVRGTCDNARNLSDAHVRRIAEGGGVIGIGYWDVAVCGRAPADVARALAYVVRLAGPEHAALGSDYDGATTVGFDTRQLPALTQALLDEGLEEAEIRLVLGKNVQRVLLQNLPAMTRNGG